MTVPCSHPRTGLVTSRPLGGIEDSYAATPVCDLPECVAEALEWVSRMAFGKPAYHVPQTDGGAASPPADSTGVGAPAADESATGTTNAVVAPPSQSSGGGE